MTPKPAYEELEKQVAELEKAVRKRQLAETALRQNEDKYRQLFELESDALFLIDNANGRITWLRGSSNPRRLADGGIL